ncbi:proline dehydrogenase family protein [Undibacterium sp. Di26W]|uniref:proline dehydrogenase family protein n=1 Tax=Undibacterium sp. Di26W TaxID=3413035 RepID=UPI003BF28A3C
MQLINTLVAHAIPWLPRALIQSISRRYIAGNKLADALVRIHELNALGFQVTVDVLGESAGNLSQVTDTTNEYIRLLHAIHAHGLNAGISVKPTALGLLLHPAQCEQMLMQIVDVAEGHALPVCMDMEDVSCTQMEIELFIRLKQYSNKLSLALQAYLQRSYADIEQLIHLQSSLRLCKGIYAEDQSHLVKDAWRDRSAINAHFLHHVSRCFDAGTFIAIATHDQVLVRQIVAMIRQRHIAPTQFEFQMLLGVCEPLRDWLREMGFCVRIYVPYGEDWYGYSTRRMKENPRIAGYVLRAMLGL